MSEEHPPYPINGLEQISMYLGREYPEANRKKGEQTGKFAIRVLTEQKELVSKLRKELTDLETKRPYTPPAIESEKLLERTLSEYPSPDGLGYPLNETDGKTE